MGSEIAFILLINLLNINYTCVDFGAEAPVIFYCDLLQDILLGEQVPRLCVREIFSQLNSGNNSHSGRVICVVSRRPIRELTF